MGVDGGWVNLQVEARKFHAALKKAGRLLRRINLEQEEKRRASRKEQLNGR